jgi:glutathione-specific gamma-glutamylcyclotransferase
MTQAVGSAGELVVFAYGSLLFRPGFQYRERHPASAPDFARSFRQSSPDHRGTPERPGRVVTLITQAGASCAGAVYFVGESSTELLRDLDHRERAGYERVELEVLTLGRPLRAVTWIARPGNPYDAGELELAELAELIRLARGPSGANSEYVFLLERALDELGVTDPAVSALAALLR